MHSFASRDPLRARSGVLTLGDPGIARDRPVSFRFPLDVTCVEQMRATMDVGGALLSPSIRLQGNREGPLRGLEFVAKDLFSVKGWRNSFGTPKWLETHPASTRHSDAVDRLLLRGADLVGMAHLDEMAYSLNGENAHYGTPINPRCSERVPGGSSSGCASYVASGGAHFAVGTDTAGSVRVPASYCGLFGMRPTHGRVSLRGACPLAPSFDTAGWMARDPKTLRQVGLSLLSDVHQENYGTKKRRITWRVGTDALSLADAEVAERFVNLMQKCTVEWADGLGVRDEVQVGDDASGGLEGWIDVFRLCQGAEVWAMHGEWITRVKPAFGPGIKERFDMASKITSNELEEAAHRRKEVQKRMEALLCDNAILVVPTTPGPAPLKETPQAELEQFRRRLISVTSIASLAGLPEVTLPLLSSQGCPVGLSFIGAPGTDEILLEAAEEAFNLLST